MQSVMYGLSNVIIQSGINSLGTNIGGRVGGIQ